MDQSGFREIDFRIFKHVDAHSVSYSAGNQILAPGDMTRKMYIIKSGRVAIIIGGTTVAELSDGEIFGEMGIVDPRPHTASIVAITDVNLYGINEQQFLQLVSTTPTFAIRVMRVLARRTRAMNSRLHAAAM